MIEKEKERERDREVSGSRCKNVNVRVVCFPNQQVQLASYDTFPASGTRRRTKRTRVVCTETNVCICLCVFGTHEDFQFYEKK